MWSGKIFTAKFLSILSLIPGQQLRPAGFRPEEGAVRVPGRTIQQDRNERPLALLCCVLGRKMGVEGEADRSQGTVRLRRSRSSSSRALGPSCPAAASWKGADSTA